MTLESAIVTLMKVFVFIMVVFLCTEVDPQQPREIVAALVCALLSIIGITVFNRAWSVNIGNLNTMLANIILMISVAAINMILLPANGHMQGTGNPSEDTYIFEPAQPVEETNSAAQNGVDARREQQLAREREENERLSRMRHDTEQRDILRQRREIEHNDENEKLSLQRKQWHQEECCRLEEEHIRIKKQIKQWHEQQTLKLEDEQRRRKEQNKQHHEEECRKLEEAQKRIKEQINQWQEKLCKLEEEHKKKMAERIQYHEEEYCKLEEEHRRTIEQRKQWHKDECQKQEEEQKRTKKQIILSHKEECQKLEQEYKRIEEQLKSGFLKEHQRLREHCRKNYFVVAVTTSENTLIGSVDADDPNSRYSLPESTGILNTGILNVQATATCSLGQGELKNGTKEQDTKTNNEESTERFERDANEPMARNATNTQSLVDVHSTEQDPDSTDEEEQELVQDLDVGLHEIESKEAPDD